LKRKSGVGSINDEEFCDFNLDLLTASFNWFFWDLDETKQVNNTFVGDTSHILDHFLGHVISFESDGLDSDKSFSQNDETAVSLGSDVVDSSSDKDFLILEGVIERPDFSPFSSGDKDGFEERIVTVLVDFVVYDFDGFVCFHGAKISC
jgi:hypothetical protein